MSKTKISEFSSDPALNTDIDGINIAEGCAPSGINNAIRELMAQLKDWQSGTSLDTFNTNYMIATAVDINGGAIDGATIGAASAAAGTFTTATATTVNSTTVDTTNIEVTNIKAKDGTAAGSIADATGVVTLASSVLTTTDINGGTIDNTAIGGATPAAGAFTTLSASSTVTLSGGTANGVAYLDGSKVLTSGSALTFDGTNLGVGTTSPDNKLEVAVGDNGGINIEQTGSSQTGYLNWRDSDGTLSGRISYDHGSDAMRFAISSTEQMRLTSTGLGIGTSSPAVKLQVYNNINGTPFAWGNAARTGYLYQDADGVGITNASGTSFDEGVYLDTANSKVVLYTNSTARATLDSSGNLGLGVTPSAWGGSYKAFQLANTGRSLAATGAGAGDLTLAFNAIYDSTDSRWEYAGTGDAAVRYSQTGAGIHAWYTAPSGTAGNAITFTQAMTLDSSGNLLVGTTSAAGKLTVAKSDGRASFDSLGGYFTIDLSSNGNRRAFFGYNEATAQWQLNNVTSGGTEQTVLLYDRTSNYLSLGTNGSERMRIDSSGNLLVGATSGTARGLFIQDGANSSIQTGQTNASFASTAINIRVSRDTSNGTYNFIGCTREGVADVLFVRDSGNVVNANNSYGAISDAKLKENVTDATPKLEKLNQVRIVNFNMKGSDQKQLGVIAQEIEQIFPGMVEETVDRDEEGNDLGTTTKSVKYSVFVPMLIKAMQEQQAIIESLKSRLDAAGL